MMKEIAQGLSNIWWTLAIVVAFAFGMGIYLVRLPFYAMTRKRRGEPFLWAAAFGFGFGDGSVRWRNR